MKLGAAHIAAIGKSKSHDSGRRWLQAPVRQDVGLNPTADVPECQSALTHEGLFAWLPARQPNSVAVACFCDGMLLAHIVRARCQERDSGDSAVGSA